MSQAILDRRRAGTPAVGGWRSACFGVESVVGSFEEVEGVEVAVDEAFSGAVASIVLSDVNSIGVYGEYTMGVYGEGYVFDRVRGSRSLCYRCFTIGQIV